MWSTVWLWSEKGAIAYWINLTNLLTYSHTAHITSPYPNSCPMHMHKSLHLLPATQNSHWSIQAGDSHIFPLHLSKFSVQTGFFPIKQTHEAKRISQSFFVIRFLSAWIVLLCYHSSLTQCLSNQALFCLCRTATEVWPQEVRLNKQWSRGLNFAQMHFDRGTKPLFVLTKHCLQT